MLVTITTDNQTSQLVEVKAPAYYRCLTKQVVAVLSETEVINIYQIEGFLSIGKSSYEDSPKPELGPIWKEITPADFKKEWRKALMALNLPIVKDQIKNRI